MSLATSSYINESKAGSDTNMLCRMGQIQKNLAKKITRLYLNTF
jgi:hypothetical protein